VAFRDVSWEAIFLLFSRGLEHSLVL